MSDITDAKSAQAWLNDWQGKPRAGVLKSAIEGLKRNVSIMRGNIRAYGPDMLLNVREALSVLKLAWRNQHGAEFPKKLDSFEQHQAFWAPKGKKTVAKKKATAKRLCLSAGYAFEFNPATKNTHTSLGDAWKKASDEAWDITTTGNEPVAVLGRRSIDGAECVICRVLSGENKGKIMAQTAVMFGKEC